MKPIKLKINTETESYPIIIGSNLVSKFSNLININSIKLKNHCYLLIKIFQKRCFHKLKGH